MKNYKLLIIAPLLVLSLSACRDEPLLKGLDQYQANEVIATLQRNNISAVKLDKGKIGYNVSVQKTDIPAAVDLLKIHALPSKPRMEIAAMFPSDSLVSSPRAEKARLYSAIEQRLEQSLQTMEGVLSARVHVSYDIDSGETGRAVAPVHLSTLVSYQNDVDEMLMINDIKRFLKNSFNQVDYNNISVVLSKQTALQRQSPMENLANKPRQSTNIIFAAAGIVILLLSAGVFYYWRRFKTPQTDRVVADDNHNAA
jgi:type III secretion protein J